MNGWMDGLTECWMDGLIDGLQMVDQSMNGSRN